MNSSSNITSLSDIKERKKQIEAELDYSQKALVDSVTPASVSAKNFLLQDLVVPVIGIGTALFLASKVMSRRKSANVQTKEEYLETNNKDRPASSSGMDYQRPVMTREIKVVQKPKKKRLASIIKLGTIMIPAAQAIMAAVQENKGPKSHK